MTASRTSNADRTMMVLFPLSWISKLAPFVGSPMVCCFPPVPYLYLGSDQVDDRSRKMRLDQELSRGLIEGEGVDCEELGDVDRVAVEVQGV